MKIRLGFIALLFLMGSCSYFSDPGSELILNVDNEFEIEMVELLQPDERALSIKITLLDQLNCKESELGLNKNTKGNDLNIIIENINVPQICQEGTSYPHGAVDFQLDNKRYNLGIQVQDQVNQNGSLQVTDRGYTLDLSNTKGLIIENPVINKIPNRFVWGFYQVKNANEVENIDNFLVNNDYSTRPLTYLTPGSYSYFSISDEGLISVNNTPSSGIVKHLAFDLLDLNEIKEVVSNYKAEHPDVNLVLYGSDGSVF